MSRQPKLRPKSYVAGFPDAIYDFSAVPTLSQLETRNSLSEEKSDQRVFRVKRKHVLKACDRCRVKKTKCDGKQPCNRCSSYNHPCLFRERKATPTKVYSRGFVEMLESHHSLVVKALQRLYRLCANKEGFPGEPLVEASDGYPLTHAILDRLGLIKQAEDNSEELEGDSEDIQYLRALTSSTDCSATAEPSPEPTTPPDPSPSTSSPVQLSPGGVQPVKWEHQPLQPEQYHSYPQTELRDVVLPPQTLEPVTLATDLKCTTVPSPTGLGNPYIYYTNGTCGPDPTGNRHQPVVSTGPGALPTVSEAGMSVDMTGGYSLHLPDHQPGYPPVAPAWTSYTCE
ncbi:hypothetical protein BJX61DRAFT_536312 [Aspergillus egyptiacus]|nr:hypothetical protein BJX61DRAFT_536312 [Aspergillus egyptiacus]